MAQAFKSSNYITWEIRNRWSNVFITLRNMNCIVTHIYKEGNQVADSLANFGLTLNSYVFKVISNVKQIYIKYLIYEY